MASSNKRDRAVEKTSAESGGVMVSSGAAERAQRKKIVILALLLVVLLAASYGVFSLRAETASQSILLPPKGFEPPDYVRSIGESGNGALLAPIGIAIGSNGRVYVVDNASRSVKVYKTGGSYLFSFNAVRVVSWDAVRDGVSQGMSNPVHIAAGKDGSIYVTDRSRRSVYVFDADGKFQRELYPSDGLGSDWSPLGVGADDAGNIYVTDVPSPAQHRVVIMDSEGRVKGKFGRGGQVSTVNAGKGSFYYPNGIAVTGGANRSIYVADSNNGRVQVFNESGSPVNVLATGGAPRGVALNSRGQLFAVDVLGHKVDMYSPEGVELGSFGENGSAPGQFQYPEDVAVDGSGRIYVTDRGNGRVQVFAFSNGLPGAVPDIAALGRGQSPWCLAFPVILVLLLAMPLLFGRRRLVVTQDFVKAMADSELVKQMDNPKWRWVVSEPDHEAFEGRVVDGVDLGSLLHADPYSYTDAKQLADRFEIPLDRAAVLSLATRHKVLCTEDPELSRLAVRAGADVYDRAAFVTRFLQGRDRLETAS